MTLVFALLIALAGLSPAAAADRAGRGGITVAQTPEVCTEIYQPVCGTDAGGKRITYPNECYARRAKATNITPGPC
jgi:hypothetical protein